MKPLTLFVVPHGAERNLTEDGWVFVSNLPLSADVVPKLTAYFDVCIVEEYLGIKKFQNKHTQVNAVLDEDGRPCEISVRTSLPHARVRDSLHQLLAGENVDIVVIDDAA